MAPTSRWRRILRIAVFTVGVLLLGTVASVRIQQQILRWRAERLLSDIRELQLGKSTWADAQTLIYRWGAWGWYEGSCTEKRCSYQIVMQDVYAGFPVYSSPSVAMRKGWRRSRVWMLFPYQILGGRPAQVSARMEVIDGVVWAKDYRIELQVSTGLFPSNSDYGLEASASTAWRTADLRGFDPDHPDYVVSRPGGCTGCVIGYSMFTPYADARVVHSLMDFNLDCLTRKVICRDQMDIMPTAWKQFEAKEQNDGHATKKSQISAEACLSSADFVGRDRRNVVIAEVVATQTEHDFSGSHRVVSFRLKQPLKRAEFWKLSETARAAVPNYLVAGDGSHDGFVTPTREIILAIGQQYDSLPDWIELDPCDVLPLTDQNLAAVRRGISRDIFPSDNRRWP